MSRFLAKVALLSFALLVVLSCRKKSDPIATDPDGTAPPVAVDVEGLLIRLSNADSAAGERPPVRVVEAEPLDAAQTSEVLARLPKLEAEPSDQQDFAVRAGSSPPPRTGTTVRGPFPPKPVAPVATPRPTGPLEIVRFAPEGAVPLAPHLSVTFSHPMVPVTSIEELAAGDVPVRLEPQPTTGPDEGLDAGKWRWVGTKTLMFEPAPRFPMATRYEVTVPAGTRSAVGTTLATAKTWTFTTPAPTLEASYPNDQAARRQPLMFAAFDQRIDPAAVAGTITVRAGTQTVSVRLARPEEVQADPTVSQLAAQAEDDRWLAFVPVSPLPADSPVTVRIGPGTPSAEGPLTTTKAQTFSFRTYGRMKVVEHRCGYDGECPPGSPFEIQFSNPVDVEAFDRSRVTVEPALPGLRTEVYGEYLYIFGQTKGRTTYAVTLSPEIRDVFGQPLGVVEPLRFSVGRAPASVFMQGSGLTVLDPAAGGKISAFSVNQRTLSVQAWAVDPDDWRAYLQALERLGNDPQDLSMPGRKVIDDTITVRRDDDQIVETPIDLAPGLRRGKGHVIVVVQQTTRPAEPWMMQRAVAWVQVTDLGLQAHVDAQRMLAWTTSLATGTPLAGVDVQLRAVGVEARTDASGLASLPLVRERAQMVVARKGNDVAFLPESIGWWNPQGSWHVMAPEPVLQWYVFDDRGLYRPGEAVKVKGWLRTFDPSLGGDLGGVGGKVRQVDYALRDAQGNEVAKGRLSLNAFGAFDTSIELPDAMNLGQASLVLQARGWTNPGAEHWHGVRVEEFRRPEYEVTTQISEGPHVVGQHAVATVRAEYFAGGGLTDAEVDWQVSSSPGHYQPPGHDQFVFGKQEPWWRFWGGWGPPRPEDEPRVVSFDAFTDASGEHRLRMDFVAVDPPRAMSVSAQATVTDVNRQAWTSTSNLLVHPSALYVGLRSDRAFVQAGEDIDVDVVVVDIDGEVQPGVSVLVRSARVEYVQEHGERVEREVEPQTCRKDSAATPVRCSLPTELGGSHRVMAVVVDGKGRPNETELTLWVAGGELPAPRDVAQEQVLLIPDRQEYAAGDVAKIAVSAPWAPAEGLVTLRRSGLVESRVIHLEATSTTIEVPIEEAMTPSLTVQVDVVGAAPRRGEDGTVDPSLPKRPGFAVGAVALSVPPRQRTLQVQVEPGHAKIEPGGKTTVAVEVKDAAGRPVKDAEVALVVVDEAVLSLTGYTLPDPIATFYGWRDPGVRDHHLRQHVLLARAGDLTPAPGDAVGGGGLGRAGGGVTTLAEGAPAADKAAEAPSPPSLQAGQDRAEGAPEIALREDFSALALFLPSVRTDGSGRARVPLTVPDNLTRYRIMAVAVAGERQFGKAESSITARLPLMVRPSPPRFLNFGDVLELPVVLQNQTEKPMVVHVAVRAHDLDFTAGQGRRVSVPAGDRVEVRFPSKAEYAGTARVQVGAVAGPFTDAAAFSLPVWTPATTEAFATYGEIDDDGPRTVVQPVAVPPGVFPQFGGLDVSTSSTAVQALTDAVLYLVSYPFECTEQLASRVLAIAALRDVLEAFEAEGLPPPAELVAAVERDLSALRRMQNDDGGFSFWGRGRPSWPYVTVHVAHAIERAREKGFGVPADMRTRVLAYLADIERRLDSSYPEDVRHSIRAYALYVLRLAGQPDAPKAQILVDTEGVEALPLEALAWVLPTLHEGAGTRALADRIERHLGNRVTETAATAHFATAYEDGAHLVLHSDRRVDALVLEALMITEPDRDLIPKLVQGLLAQRRAGHWSNTQENAFVLVALDRYFGQYERVTPRFVARVWLGDTFAGQERFAGRTTKTWQVQVPMQWLFDHDREQDLVIDKNGVGRLYYRVGLRYAPRDLKLPPYDAGFVVEREYEAVDDEDDVRRDADGTWHIKAGARVRVRLKMIADGRRYHVALVDPLPAGLEPLNPVLVTTGALPPDPEDEADDRWWWWTRTWYEHQNLRDERVEAFTSLLWSGVYDYDYLARATTPGRFVVPPPKAEEMYHPETFGRGSGDVVVVE